jgi:hypothetical protein
MRHSRLILLVLVTAATSAFGAPKVKNWKTGKVLDSQAVKTRAGIAATAEAIPTIRDTQLMILGDEFAFVIEDSRVSGSTSLIGLTARTISNRHQWKKKAIPNFHDTNDKECKAEVLRQDPFQSSKEAPQ